MGIAVLDLTLPTLVENLALDEALLLHAEKNGGLEMLRFWEWPTPAVVLGAGGSLERDVDTEARVTDGVPIQRRASGGGTVLLSKGSLVFSLVLNLRRDDALRDIRASYRFILQRISHALRSVASLSIEGISDLAVDGRKVSGNSQQRKSQYLLHHGTLLYDFDLSLLNRYLRMPAKQPDYRQARSHDQFVTNLSVEPAIIKRLLLEEWCCDNVQNDIPLEHVKRLVADKYSTTEWVQRR
jgi:lipoate-protein ligase A